MGPAEDACVAGGAESRIVAVISRVATVVARDVDELAIALLAVSSVRVGRGSAQRLRERIGRQQLEAGIVEARDGSLIGWHLEISEAPGVVRHLQSRVLRDSHVEDLDRIEPWLREGDGLGETPRR